MKMGKVGNFAVCEWDRMDYCFSCQSNDMVCSCVSAIDGLRDDGRKFATMKASYKCKKCFREWDKALTVEETFIRDNKVVCPLPIPEVENK